MPAKYEIVKDKPKPVTKKDASEYPLAEMEDGDCFFVPCEKPNPSIIKMCNDWGKKQTPKVRFIGRQHMEGGKMTGYWVWHNGSAEDAAENAAEAPEQAPKKKVA